MKLLPQSQNLVYLDLLMNIFRNSFKLNLTLILLNVFLVSCEDKCDGDPAPLPVAISYVGKMSSDNLLEVDGVPIARENVTVKISQIVNDVPQTPFVDDNFLLTSTPQFEDLGTYLFLEFERVLGSSYFIINVLELEPDTVSFIYEGRTVNMFYKGTLISSHRPCEGWDIPTIRISK